MEQKRIVDLLNDEIFASHTFTNQNFGLKYGDGFRELATEFLGNYKACSTVIVDAMISSMTGDKFAKAVKMLNDSGVPAEVAVCTALRNNPDFVIGYIGHLYWGIQIGRKLAEQERSALQGMETKEHS